MLPMFGTVRLPNTVYNIGIQVAAGSTLAYDRQGSICRYRKNLAVQGSEPGVQGKKYARVQRLAYEHTGNIPMTCLFRWYICRLGTLYGQQEP